MHQCMLYSAAMSCILLSQNNGKEISWRCLCDLYHRNRSESGLALIPKLKNKHVHLTSFWKMRVDLAAQVRYCVCEGIFQQENLSGST